MKREKLFFTPLIQGSLVWLIGLILTRWLNPPGHVAFILILLALVARYLYRADPVERKIANLAIVFALAVGRMIGAQPVIDESQVAYYNDYAAPVTLTGLVVAEPEVRDNQVKLQLQAETLQLTHQTRPVQGLVMVNAPRYPLYQYGDRLMVTGNLENPPVFEDFSYKDYLANQQIYSLIRRPHIKLLAQQQGNPFWATMLAFKQHTSATINRILPEPQASLLNGILLGIETNIPPKLYDDFRKTGTSHIIVISGSNIAIVVIILSLLGQKFWERRAFPLPILVGLGAYTVLVGADPSVSRAAMMGGIVVWGRWLGRPSLALNSLMAAQMALTVIDPMNLLNLGFQLSFMATLGLIVLVSPLEQGMSWLARHFFSPQPLSFGLAIWREFFLITLAAQIATMPLLMYYFNQLSLVAPFTNLLIEPAQPFIMTLGGLATLAGLIWLPLGELLGWLAGLPLIWTVMMVQWTASWPYAGIELERWPGGLVCLWYAVMAVAVWWAQQPREAVTLPTLQWPKIWQSRRTRPVILSLGAGLALLGAVYITQPDGYLHVAFLDVGQGDAIFITLPDGRQILIDGGPSATSLQWRLGQEMPFWDRSLDLLINTHSDADHLGGLVSLLDRYQIDQILVSDLGGRSSLYQAWQQQLPFTPTVAHAGMALTLAPNITATILSPGAASEHETATNNHSIVLRLQMGQVSFLFTGDIEATVEERLVRDQAPLLAATVLKSPHHGSNTSSSEPFLQAVNPQVVVISVGADNSFGHPRPEILARYAAHGLTVLRTDEQGTVELVTDGRQLWVGN